MEDEGVRGGAEVRRTNDKQKKHSSNFITAGASVLGDSNSQKPRPMTHDSSGE